MVRARMEVWLITEPCRVTKPRSLDLSICTVSPGVRLSAARMAGRSPRNWSCPVPLRTLTTRWDTSRTSEARACM